MFSLFTQPTPSVVSRPPGFSGTNAKTTGSLAAAATISNKKVNQDAYAVAQSSKFPLTGVLIADGLGSHFRAEIASRITAETFQEEVGGWESFTPAEVGRLFRRSRQRLERYVDDHAGEFPPEIDWKNAFGTTVLVVLETVDEYVLAYLGNGAIFHIRGNFSHFPASQLMPWTAVNYLNPHAISLGGKNVLYKLLSVSSSEAEMTPTVMVLKKDQDPYGDIFMVCSDGVYSYDQVPMGRDSAQEVWIKGEPSLLLFFEQLKSFVAGDQYTNDALEKLLEAYLLQLKERNLVTDDCTLGVLVSERALRYHVSLRNSHANGTSQ